MKLANVRDPRSMLAPFDVFRGEYGVDRMTKYGPFSVLPHPNHAGFLVVDSDGFCWGFSLSKAECKRAIDDAELTAARVVMAKGTAAEGL